MQRGDRLQLAHALAGPVGSAADGGLRRARASAKSAARPWWPGAARSGGLGRNWVLQPL